MALSLNRLSAPVEGCVLCKGPRVFGLIGKVTRFGLDSFGPEDVSHRWALTVEHGCLRLEHLAGDEELTGDRLFLPTSLAYSYGLTGGRGTIEMARAVFGLLPAELELLVTVLRRGGFPVLGFSHTDMKCSITSAIIPGCWPHVVTSNLAIYGNVISLETFARIVASSLPEGRLASRFPVLRPVFKQLMRLLVVRRRGAPYTKEMLELAPTPTLAAT